MPERYTAAAANELLPYLAPTLIELRTKYERAGRAREAMERAAAGNGCSAQRDRWTKTLARVQELMARIEGWNLEVKDIESGLVDFPTEVGGRDAYLCWKLGEPEVAHWHYPEDGFAGRRPL